MGRHILLVQLSIPPLVPGGVSGNIPLAGAYLQMYARLRGMEQLHDISILPPALANHLSDVGLVEEILARSPDLVGFTCYLWNIERTLWVAERLKQQNPRITILVGGPEITVDNAWVLQHPAVDFAIIGEGEQTFAEFLAADPASRDSRIAGLMASGGNNPGSPLSLPVLSGSQGCGNSHGFQSRKPLPRLDEISSPYLAGILDAADEKMLLLETIRGCTFKCKFCYYPKSYDGLYFLSEEKIVANLRHALERGATEVVLLDPTLNQRRDFEGFLKLLVKNNPRRQLTFFGELRAEGIKDTTASLLAEAGFTEVEVGLQSIDPAAMRLMDRKNNLAAIERGCRAMLAAGIRVKVDLIVGLPGDTVESIRRSLHYLRDSGIYSDVQVFNLAILPGTAFRQEAGDLGLVHQPRPPYYVRRTPTLHSEDLFEMMREAAQVFDVDWDPLPDPLLPSGAGFQLRGQNRRLQDHAVVELDDPDDSNPLRAASQRSQAFTLWLKSSDFTRDRERVCRWIRRILAENPFTTLQVVLQPLADPRHITEVLLSELWSVCQERPTYLDAYYALQPGRPIGAKRIVVLVNEADGERCGEEWRQSVQEQADFAKICSSQAPVGSYPVDCGQLARSISFTAIENVLP